MRPDGARKGAVAKLFRFLPPELLVLSRAPGGYRRRLQGGSRTGTRPIGGRAGRGGKNRRARRGNHPGAPGFAEALGSGKKDLKTGQGYDVRRKWKRKS